MTPGGGAVKTPLRILWRFMSSSSCLAIGLALEGLRGRICEALKALMHMTGAMCV